MTIWVLNNAQGIVAVLEVLGFVVIGGLAFTGMFGGKIADRRNESDQLADGLIKRLQQTLEQQSTDIKDMSIRIDDQQREIHLLQGKNEAYLQIITLRDPATVKVFDEAPEIYRIARETNQFVKEQAESIKNLTRAMEEFINRLPPLMPSMTV